MKCRFVWLVAFTLAVMVIASSAGAGPILDDILNSMQIDQSLQRSGDDSKPFSHDRPVGQTFVTGDKVVTICRIALIIGYNDESWKPGETAVLTLWDGPTKKTELGRFGVPYERRRWSGGIMMFSVEAKVQPNHEYYFELSVDGGDGTVGNVLLAKWNIDYPKGTIYEDSKPQERDIWFETHVKKLTDRNADYAAFFDNFDLDRPGLAKVKASVQVKDWETACREFISYFESKKDLFNDEDATPKPDPAADTKEADLVADQKWPAQDGTIVDLGPNWNYFASWPTLGGVGLTRTGLMKPLAFTYTKTGNEKYARAWNDMLISTFRNVPCPLKSGVITTDGRIRPTIPAGISGTLWDSISLAARLHHETFYNRFRKSPLFTQDARMAWWANLAEMVNTLERMDAGGNWTTQNTSSLFSFAEKYPEFKKANQWFAQGFEGLKANLLENMYPDGPCREATTGYHCFSLGMFLNSVQRAQKAGLDVPKECMERLESAFQYTMYTTQSDWQMPVWGDTNRPLDGTGLIQLGGRYFNRPDMIWVGTKGKEGKHPVKASVDFPTAGYYIMRSGWDTKARFLVTRNGFSNSHYHSDNLSLIVNAYGTDLLPDAGIYTYGTPECNELVKTNRHSTICVDDKNIMAGNGSNQWSTNPGFDYFEGIAPGYQDLKDVQYRRAVLFVKPDYWVVVDSISGPGEHSVVQNWRFTPGKLSMDSAGITRTSNTKGGNLAIIPLFSAGRKDELGKDVYAITGTKVINDAPVARYQRTGVLPFSFCTVLFPYPADSEGKVSARELSCVKQSDGTRSIGTRISSGKQIDYVVFGASGGAFFRDSGDAKAPELGVQADAAMVRMDAKGRISSFGLRNGSKLAQSGVVLAESGSVVPSLSVRYSKGIVTVDAEGAGPDLRIATMGSKRAIVNGREMTLTKGSKTFSPFGTAGS